MAFSGADRDEVDARAGVPGQAGRAVRPEDRRLDAAGRGPPAADLPQHRGAAARRARAGRRPRADLDALPEAHHAARRLRAERARPDLRDLQPPYLFRGARPRSSSAPATSRLRPRRWTVTRATGRRARSTASCSCATRRDTHVDRRRPAHRRAARRRAGAGNRLTRGARRRTATSRRPARTCCSSTARPPRAPCRPSPSSWRCASRLARDGDDRGLRAAGHPRRPHHPRRGVPRGAQAGLEARVDFGPEIGRKRSSAQITHYAREELEGRLVMAVVNFPPRQIGPVISEVLVLGVPDEEGRVILLRPDADVPLGRADVLGRPARARSPSAAARAPSSRTRASRPS